MGLAATLTRLIALLGGAASTTAWQPPRNSIPPESVGYPHGGGQQHPLAWAPIHDDDNIDIVTGSQFHGLKTWGNLPYVNCFSDEEAQRQDAKYDIAILGAPFDTGTTGRPGARFGPQGIRTGSQRISPQGTSIYTGETPLSSWARIVDTGDVLMTFLDNTVALRQLDKAHRIISGRPAANASVSQTPRILTLGGDHTTTLSALRSAHERWGDVSVIHFDSHIDTWDPAVLGGGLSDYAGVNHGTFLHIAHEEGLIRNTSVHAGIRAPVIRPKDDVRNDRRCGFEIITARAIDKAGGADGIVEQIKRRVGDSNVYISVDIDVLDPAYAPATGTAEPGGWTSRELLTILDGLVGLKVIGADVVEVAPVYDNAGETTVLAAAEVTLSLLALMVDTPVQSKADKEALQQAEEL